MRWPLVLPWLAIAGALAASPTMAADQRDAVAIAVADFDYRDTSNEARDQTAEHAARLAAFTQKLREDLAHSGRYRVVAISCDGEPCSAGRSDSSVLVAAARNGGAKLLLYGGIQKTSTLVQWAKVNMIDLESERVVLDRLLTFRGDSDEAWRQAESFLARDLTEQRAAK